MFCGGLYEKYKTNNTNKSLNKLITFKPPFPPSYTISSNGSNKKRGPQYSKCIFVPKDTYPIFPWIEHQCFLVKKPHNKSTIVILYIKNKSNKNTSKNTIIYSHGSSFDLGTLFPTLIDISTVLKCDVISYDYTGYGQSTGEFQEKEIYSDIDEVIDFTVVNLHIDIEHIVLLGNSIGTVPSFYIAAKPQFCGVYGMILISPIASGNNLIKYKDGTLPKEADVFNTIEFSKEIICPVLIIHGKLDTVIPVEQSNMLGKNIKNRFVWIPNKGTHWNLFTCYRSKTFRKIIKYLNFLKDNRTKLSCRNKILDFSGENDVDTTVVKFDSKNKQISNSES